MAQVGSSGSTDTEKVMRMKDEQISLLEKDVFYYKHKKKELEAHVKDIVEAGDATLQRYRTDEREVCPSRRAPTSCLNLTVVFVSCAAEQLAPGEPQLDVGAQQHESLLAAARPGLATPGARHTDQQESAAGAAATAVQGGAPVEARESRLNVA